MAQSNVVFNSLSEQKTILWGQLSSHTPNKGLFIDMHSFFFSKNRVLGENAISTKRKLIKFQIWANPPLAQGYALASFCNFSLITHA